ncbi:MAG: 50S ribosomal protein L18e [Theionarchaea archaeon]|nr:50S ribosomal protein L18e [Theionarchaea archaeon]
MKKMKKTNPNLVSLIELLRTEGYTKKIPLWIALSKRLSKPTRRTAEVNLSRIARYTQKGDTVVVPGKVLGAGILNHSVTVAAFAFSQSAREKIDVVGRTLTIPQLMEENPKGTGVKIME